MPDGGKLTLETRNVVLDEDYASHEQRREAGQLRHDRGERHRDGNPRQLLDKVFEPFFTTKDVGKGTGLGLSMVYGFVKQSNGHIKIYSEEGHGTTVKLYLPQATGIATDVLAAGPGIAGFRTRRQAILIVEDDALVREYVVTQISSLGYKTLAASNAAEALAIINGPDRIDLLFTDVIIPGGLNGRQLATEALTRRPELKILYTSGYTENAIVHHGRLEPACCCCRSPTSAPIWRG